MGVVGRVGAESRMEERDTSLGALVAFLGNNDDDVVVVPASTDTTVPVLKALALE